MEKARILVVEDEVIIALQLETKLENMGYEVVRFHHEDDWESIVTAHPHVFGVIA